jgi:hypothetical protein
MSKLCCRTSERSSFGHSFQVYVNKIEFVTKGEKKKYEIISHILALQSKKLRDQGTIFLDKMRKNPLIDYRYRIK